MLDPQDYAVGRNVRLNGTELHVRGVIADMGFNRWLVVSQPNDHIAALLPEAAVAEEAEAVDPADVTGATVETVPAAAPTPPPPSAFTNTPQV